MHDHDRTCLEDARELFDQEVCLYEVSKNVEGQLNRWYAQREECREPRCETLKTGHLLSLEVTAFECDSPPSVALDGQLVVPQLVTAFANADPEARGLHTGAFTWQGNDVLVRGTLSGNTNVGTHREPHFDQCEGCDEKYHMEGRLCGRIVKARGEWRRLRGCQVTAVYHFRYDPVGDTGNAYLIGVIEGLIVCACGGYDNDDD